MNPHRTALTIAGASTIAAVAAAGAEVSLIAPAGPWPAPIVDAVNPLAGTPFLFNGDQVDEHGYVQVCAWLGGRKRTAITRPVIGIVGGEHCNSIAYGRAGRCWQLARELATIKGPLHPTELMRVYDHNRQRHPQPAPPANSAPPSAACQGRTVDQR